MKKTYLFATGLFFQSTLGYCCPTLILLSGPPGWGKTTLSKRLSAEFHLVRLDFDSIAEPFSPGVRDQNYALDIEPRVVASILNLAKYNLEANRNVIIDGTWSHLFYLNKDYMSTVQSLVRQLDVKLIVIEGRATNSTVLERIRGRNLPQDQTKLENPDAFFEHDHVGMPTLLPSFELSGEGSIEDVLEGAREILFENL